uniref:Uncharacterized protein n=1 Tax=Pristionchus pacificus TaxID=54126 RepID=A0A8R1Z9D4_PRIPA
MSRSKAQNPVPRDSTTATNRKEEQPPRVTVVWCSVKCDMVCGPLDTEAAVWWIATRNAHTDWITLEVPEDSLSVLRNNSSKNGGMR